MGTFPTGYACGVCMRAQSGFDSFMVTQCSTVQVQWNAGQASACNWT